MNLEPLENKHEAAFLTMIKDYEKSDPEILAAFFGGKRDWNPETFKKFVAESEKAKLDWRPGANAVSVTRYVLVGAGGEILGNGIMRFPLTERTEIEGGNLEYQIPPAKRGQSFDAYTLNGMLFEAVRAGMARVLVTCESTDQNAQTAIQQNRGVLENIAEVKDEKGNLRKVARYWIRFR